MIVTMGTIAIIIIAAVAGFTMTALSENEPLTLGRLIIDAPAYQIYTEQIDFNTSTAEVKTVYLNRSE